MPAPQRHGRHPQPRLPLIRRARPPRPAPDGAEGTAGTVGAAFFRSLARCLAAAFEADVAYVAELADPPARARILACWPGGDMLPEGYEYGLADTPCEPIAQRDVISYPAGAVERFPGDGFLVCHGLDARGPDARSRRGRRRLRLRDLPRARRRRRGRDRGAADLRRARDRIEALGGRLEIESAPGAGTRLRASIPLAPRRDEREPFIEFGYDGDGGAGERSIQQILDGSKTVSISIAREWELEGGAPRIGQKLPIVDSAGRRRATVEVTRVAVLPFGRLGEDVVAAESAGTATLDEWLASHREFYAGCAGEIALLLEEPGWRLTDAEPMVVTSFRLARG